jgi:cytoskeletal protein RodZ
MKLSLCSTFIFALCGLFMAHTSPLLGQTTTAPKVKKIPFHGKLLSVDQGAQTITIAGKTPRVFHLAPTTRIIDGAGNPSSLAAAVVGEDVGGSYAKDTMTLFSVRFGAKTGSKAAAEAPAETTSTPAMAPTAPAPEAAPAPASATDTTAASTPAAATTSKPKKQTFSGKVVSVDAASGTLVVHGKADQTFTVTSATKITGADSLGSIAVGAKVSGSYMKSADGATLTVSTLKVK